MKRVFTCLLVFVFISQLALAQNQGETASDFTLKNLNDQNYTLSANKGKVILVFLVGYNCPLCLASAPTVKSELVDAFKDNSNFQVLVIDIWNGSTSAVQGFKNSTNIDAIYLQKGSAVASSWGSTKDRLFVIDSEGKIAFKGTRAAKSDVSLAKSAIQSALNSLTTSAVQLSFSGGLQLSQNYPNPVTENTKIEFEIQNSANVNLSVFDISGKKAIEPVNQFFQPGSYSININRNQLSKGIYFYKITAGEQSQTRKMIVR